MAWFEREYAVKAHTRRSAPDDYVAVLQQDALGGIGALQAAQQEYAIKTERNGDDGLGHVALMAVLMDTEFDACFVAIDMAGVWAEEGKARTDSAAQGEIEQHARDGRPHAADCGIGGIPAATEGLRRAAVGDHDAHG